MSTNELVVTPVPEIEYFTYEDANTLLNTQRLTLEMVQWVRNYLISVLENHPDQSATGNRLYLELPKDAYHEFRKYFNEEETSQYLDSFSRWIEVNWKLIAAYKNKDQTAINLSIAEWYQIADELAIFFSAINRYIDETELKTLLYDYINLKLKEINALISGNYDLEIKIYNQIREKASQIANLMALSIIIMRRNFEIFTKSGCVIVCIP